MASPLTRTEKRRPAASESTNIGDLPNQILVEILYRLPSPELVFRCKSLSKSWCNLVAVDRSFISSFIQHKKPPTTATLITKKGEEFLERMPSQKPFDLLLQKLKSSDNLEVKPVVVGAFNDLILCSAYNNDRYYYYICNSFTKQWIPLPPHPPCQTKEEVLHGFICDVPYYKYDDDNQGSGHVNIQLNDHYNCKVVRLICPDEEFCCENQLEVQIFSSDTGKWRKFIVSADPEKFCWQNTLLLGSIEPRSVACNGMLYWMGFNELDNNKSYLIELDPFTINNGDYLDCNFITLDTPDDYGIYGGVEVCLGVKGDCLQLASYSSVDKATLRVCIWDVNVGQMAEIVDERFGDGKLELSEEMANTYSIDETDMISTLVINNAEIDDFFYLLDMISLDPSDADVLFFRMHHNNHMRGTSNAGTIISYNIRTSKWSKTDDKEWYQTGYTSFFCGSLALPSWPTPLPTLPH